MHKALIALVGASGTGKSTTYRNVNTDTTYLLDLELKGLPFKQAMAFKHVEPVANPAQFDKALDKALADKECKLIVIDSGTKYFEYVLALAQQAYKGYDVWNYYNRCIRQAFDKCKNDHAVVVWTFIDEIVTLNNVDGTTTTQRRVKVKGKEWEGIIEKEFLMVFVTDVRKNKDTSKMDYLLQTNTDGLTSAKTPMGMFDEQLIPNDLAKILEAAKLYYESGKEQTQPQPTA